jgi:hypothetical protein
VSAYDAAGLRQCMKDLGLERGYLVTNGDERRTIGTDIDVVPWSQIARGEEDFGFGKKRGGTAGSSRSGG